MRSQFNKLILYTQISCSFIAAVHLIAYAITSIVHRKDWFLVAIASAVRTIEITQPW